MSALLCLLTGPVLAAQNKGDGECLKVYRTYLSNFESSGLPTEKQKIYLVLGNTNNTTKAFSIYSGWFNDESRLSNAFRYEATDIITNGLTSIN